jgi:hypothetical protein
MKLQWLKHQSFYQLMLFQKIDAHNLANNECGQHIATWRAIQAELETNLHATYGAESDIKFCQHSYRTFQDHWKALREK